MKQLKMMRRADKPAPYKLHEDFEFVQCTEDTIQLWIDAAVGLTGEPWTKQQFVERMLGDPRVDYDHIYIAVEKATGKPAATATAQIDDKHENCMLHMVSALPEYKGKGLGHAVCAKVLEHMHNEGITEMRLSTDDWRVPAIVIYLRLGFVPEFIDETMEERWDKIMAGLGKTEYDYIDGNRNSAHKKI